MRIGTTTARAGTTSDDRIHIHRSNVWPKVTGTRANRDVTVLEQLYTADGKRGILENTLIESTWNVATLLPRRPSAPQDAGCLTFLVQ